MKQWIVLYDKEMLGMLRSYKWLWLPLVFLLLGIMNPVTTYFMPQLLEANGVSAEAAAAIPVPTAAEVLAKSLSQYNTLGLLILVLAFMGVVAGERLSGADVMTLVKPVSHLKLVTAKWASLLTLTFSSFALGYAGTWYYTNILIGAVPFSAVAQSFLVYGVWLTLAVTLTLFFSSLLNSLGGTAFLTLLTLAVLNLSAGFLERYMRWSPGRLSGAAQALLSEGESASRLWLPLAIGILLALALAYGSTLASKHRQARS